VVRADVQGNSLSVDGYDALIIMGGPMSANDTYAWLVSEMKVIEAALRRGLPSLGICLGAQLIAKVYGAPVYPAVSKEIGWWPAHRVQAADESGVPLPASFVPLHWHGETFDLPTGALHLASSPAVHNQAYLVDEQALGLQFHLEATPDSVRDITQACANELTEGPWVQTASAMLAERDTRCAALKDTCYSLLDAFFSGLPPSDP
jgi:GMP synthase-like glutamine amidotransferase